MRICLIAPPWVAVPPPSYGGTEEVLDTLARGLVRAGCDVLLVATGDSTCPVERSWTFEQAIGVDLGLATVAAELRQVVHGYEAAERWGADLVHDHTLVGPVYGLSYTRIPTVTTNHGPFTAPDLAPLYRSISNDVPVIAISEHHASSAPPTRVAAVIRHGVDVDDFPVGTGGGGYAAFLGRMHPDKGVDVACQVARAAGMPLRVAAKMREARERAFFEAEVRPLLGGDIEYVGELDGREKRQLLADATALLNPISWHEPFGMVMVESLACATPVVARPRGSAPELIDEGVTGYLREAPAELADRLLAASELDRGACRRAAEQRFSAARMVADHLRLYERAAAARAVA